MTHIPYSHLLFQKNGKPAKEYGPSLISFMTFSFLDPLIHAASRASHLGFDKLPALRTEDRTDALVKQFLPYLDPFPGAATGAGLFWKFCVLFRRPLLAQVVLLSANVRTLFHREFSPLRYDPYRRLPDLQVRLALIVYLRASFLLRCTKASF
jgi:hypothetical protein